MQSTHLSMNGMRINSEDRLRWQDFNENPNQVDNGDGFETTNISKYLGHNLKSSEILRRSSAWDAHVQDNNADISDSLVHTHFNN